MKWQNRFGDQVADETETETETETELELACMHDNQCYQVQLKLALHISCMSIVSHGNLRIKLIAGVVTADHEAALVGTVSL